MRSWIPAVPIALGAAFSAATWSRLPATITPDLDPLLPFTLSASEPLPRGVVAIGLPVIALAVWLLLEMVSSRAGDRVAGRVMPEWAFSEKAGSAAVDRFDPTFALIVTLVVALPILIQLLFMGGALGWPAYTPQLFTTAIGFGMVLLGNVMPRTRPNWVAGVRTRRTLANADVWRNTHRRFGAALLLAGLAMMAASWIQPRSAIVVGLVGLIVAGIMAEVASRRAV